MQGQTIEIMDTTINYIVEGQGKDIIFLHGWGQNIEMMQPLSNHFKQWFRVWVIDLPGAAGLSPEPPSDWGIYEYTDMLAEFIVANQIVRPTLVGHSFGGRMSIIYAGQHADVDKVVLLDAAGIKPARGLDYYARVYTYKAGKMVGKLPGFKQLLAKKQENAGSDDYKNATPRMKTVMSKVVNEDLRHYLPDIQAPTILIWGEQDDATPLSDGKLMEATIPNAALISFANAGHYAYLEELQQVLRILESFFNVENQ